MAQKDFDDILISLGTGKWNLFHFFMIGLIIFVIPPLIFGGVFLTPKLEHICEPEISEQIITVNDCTYYTSNLNGTNNSSITCTNWEYDVGHYNSTITQDMNLVCDRAYLRSTFQTSYMLGFLIGSPINGFLSDQYGRRKVMMYGTIFCLLSHFGSTFLYSIHAIIVFRFITGFFSVVLTSGYILCLEICEPKYRSAVGIFLSLPWSIGTICYGGLAYLINDWRWLQRIAVIPGIIALPILKYCSESPRWLIINGDFKNAMKTLRQAAKWNGSEIPPEEELLSRMKQIQKSSELGKDHEANVTEKGRLKHFLNEVTLLFRTPEMRRIVLLMCILFFSSSTVFYGLSLNAVNFNLNPYMYMILGGITEIPAYSLTVPITAKFGRIAPTIISYLVCGVVILSLAFISKESIAVITTLSMVGKLCTAAAYQFIYLIATEVFPTECRTQALSMAQVVARIGSILAPLITDSTITTGSWVPSVIFGSISIIAGISTFFVPETLNTHLPETVEMLEDNARKRKLRKEDEYL